LIIAKRRLQRRRWICAWFFAMSERQQSPYDTIARRWLALIERRQEHFLDLCDSGRWRHYYTHAEFLDEMRKVLRVRDQWAAIAGLPLSEEVELDWEIRARLRESRAPPAVRPSNGIAAPRWPD
jgi:uncharacterized repeat protein (TIGR03809 family)